MYKTHVHLARWHKGFVHIKKMENEGGDITTETEENQKIIRSYYRRLYSTKLENIDKMDAFLDRYHLPKINQDQVN